MSYQYECLYCHAIHIVDYKKDIKKFCNSSHAAFYNNSKRSKASRDKQKQTLLTTLKSKNCNNSKSKSKSIPKPKKIKVWSKTCMVTGETYYDKQEYIEREWSDLPAGRSRTIKLLAKIFNIQLGTLNASDLLTKAKQQLEYAYIVENKSTLQLKTEFQIPCSNGHVANLLKAIGITRRSFSKATSLAIKSGRLTISHSYQYITGYHYDWQGLEHFYRSSYELRYYQLLDIAKYSYETKTIRIDYYDSQLQRDRIAVPDIILDNNIIIEIKSDHTYDKINMQDKFLSYKNNGYSLILNLDFVDYEINAINDLPYSKSNVFLN
jgi:hypothetical protein